MKDKIAAGLLTIKSNHPHEVYLSIFAFLTAFRILDVPQESSEVRSLVLEAGRKYFFYRWDMVRQIICRIVSEIVDMSLREG